MATGSPDNMQGDLFSRGFPKFNESYYFFTISTAQASPFTKNLAKLMQAGEIATLTEVLKDIAEIAAKKPTKVDISHALIAFSKTGLDIIQVGLPNGKLELEKIKNSDPAFFNGMANDRKLDDPNHRDWDPLFQSPTIHGMLKVAGSDAEQVKMKLSRVKAILGYPTVITDVMSSSSLSTSAPSQLDGQVRSGNNKGKEHFGFEDGVSQPLLEGIDDPDRIKNDQSMRTDQSVITVAKDRKRNGLSGAQNACPEWMYDGSFLVFRKLYQDVGSFKQFLHDKHVSAECTSSEQFGARLMGRWPSGKPYVESPDLDPNDGTGTNDFNFKNPQGCALAAHIRKVRVRGTGESSKFVRIIRNGIPYGEDYIAGEESTDRGLLFVCYQSSIENGFQHIQNTWANSTDFPKDGAGYDPFIGQGEEGKPIQTAIFNRNQDLIAPELWDIPKFVTMRGGEYFFAPSILALKSVLGSV